MYGLYVALRLAYPAGMGFGDVKLAGVLGLATGWLGWGALGVGAVRRVPVRRAVRGGAASRSAAAGRKSRPAVRPVHAARRCWSPCSRASRWPAPTSRSPAAERSGPAGPSGGSRPSGRCRDRRAPGRTSPAPAVRAGLREGTGRGRTTVVGLDIGTSGVRAAELTLGKGRRDARAVRPGGPARPARSATARWSTPTPSPPRCAAVGAGASSAARRSSSGVANQKVVVRQVDLPWLPAERAARLAGRSRCRTSSRCRSSRRCSTSTRWRSSPARAAPGCCACCSSRPSREMVASRARRGPPRPGLHAGDGRPHQLRGAARRWATAAAGLATVEAEALVDVGAAVTNIVVHQGGVPRFVRILLMGGARHHRRGRRAARRPARAGRGGQAEHRARRPCRARRGRTRPAGPSRRPAARSSRRSAGSLDYYLAQNGAARIGRVVLSGGGSRLGGLGGAAARPRPGCPVEIARPLSAAADRPDRADRRAAAVRRADGGRPRRARPRAGAVITLSEGPRRRRVGTGAGRAAAGQPAAPRDRRGLPAPPRRRPASAAGVVGAVVLVAGAVRRGGGDVSDAQAALDAPRARRRRAQTAGRPVPRRDRDLPARRDRPRPCWWPRWATRCATRASSTTWR